MNQKPLVVGVLFVLALISFTQAAFAQALGRWQSERLGRYPYFYRKLYSLFPPQGKFMTQWRIVGGLLLGVICLAAAFIFAIFGHPANHERP